MRAASLSLPQTPAVLRPIWRWLPPRLGAQTAFIGKVGADAFGRYLKEVLAENKVDVSGMAVDADHPTTMAVVSVDATGERDFSFYRSANADVMLSKEDISDGRSESCQNRPLRFCQPDR